MTGEGELPEGWVWAKLADVTDTIFGQSPPSDTYNTNEVGLPFFQGKAEFGPKHPTVVKWCSDPLREAYAGDILISVRAPVGPTNIANLHCSIGRGLAAIRPRIDRGYVWYLMQSAERILAAQGTGTTFSAISKDVLNNHPVPLPPSNEQRRIVEKIETLFSQLDKGEEALRAVQRQLARYRQSVLKAAVTGELTAGWRAENADRLEHGRDLLARILKTRRETWQGRGKYKEPAAPDTTDLPDLPEGWVWVSLEALISQGPQNGVYLPQTKYGIGVPILRIDDYQLDWIRAIDGLKLVDANEMDIKKYALKQYDFVVNRVNSVSHLGKTVMIQPEYTGALFESNMMRFSVTNEIQCRYLSQYLRSETGRKFLIKNCKHAVNQASINQKDVESTPVPLPPLMDQKQIVELVDEFLSTEAIAYKMCETELARSACLRQSILKRAFSGKLVPQDPADEPASVLLERIRASRAAAPRRKSRKAVA